MSAQRYMTGKRVAAIEATLHERDRAVLEDVARLNVASAKQLQRLHYSDSEAGRRLARHDLARLTEERVIGRLDRRVGGVRAGSSGFVYALDVAGQRIIRPRKRRYRRPWTPQPSHLRHALSVSELYVRLREVEESGRIELPIFDAEPACWRWFVGPGGGRVVLKPDAFAVTATTEFEDRWFIEVDLATESSPRLIHKAKAYVRYWQSGREQAETGVFPKVLWVVPDEPRREVAAEALSRLPAEHWRLFATATVDDALAAMADEVDGPLDLEERAS